MDMDVSGLNRSRGLVEPLLDQEGVVGQRLTVDGIQEDSGCLMGCALHTAAGNNLVLGSIA
jgi:hypothetical protein